ncbi:hypothetical protein I5E68_19715 [Novosphingobium sp. YJ-S2-02]|uniref:Uncharacterized protein n=1 Tax=Novosphingobium aureum TaxID=2792964 RepID=A0A931HG63_9SPHN|nr:hypothetical protein [Novosphingobium aureum]MBH0115174.1 hypothetical protein [Novosphingobium aureum]
MDDIARHTVISSLALGGLELAADTVSGYIQALLDGAVLSHTHYALDRNSRKAALVRFLEPEQCSFMPDESMLQSL